MAYDETAETALHAMSEPATTPPGGTPPQRFSTTCWTQVLESRGQHTVARETLRQLCQDYYSPIVTFIRRSSGREADEARDLAHAFIAHVLDGHAFDGADPNRGRFRSYLLGAVKHFLAQSALKANRQRRGGGATIESLDDDDRTSEPESGSLSPDGEFDRRWANTVLTRALEKLESECSGPGQAYPFAALRPWLTGDDVHGDQAALAAQLGMEPNTLKSHVSRLRKRFRQGVRDEVGRTLAHPDQIDIEMQALLAALRKK